ncbi:MAG: M23 family metallopeptidase [Sphingomonadales bacterium]|jgi:murein DD-endopeptidase MepM/ murein hydrolase activator NlpD
MRGRAALLAALLLAGCEVTGPPPLRPGAPAPRPQAAQTAPRTAPKPAFRPAPAPAAPPRTDWVARRVVPAAVVTPQGRFHIVKAGETGIAIARAYGATWSQLITLNQLADPFILRVGQRLRLPDAAPATPQTLEARARAFDITIDDVVTGGQPATSARPPSRAAMAPPRATPGGAPTAPLATPVPTPLPTPLPTLTGAAPQFRWPLPGRIVSGFGPKPGGRFNDGVNLKASLGEPVRAAGDGVVAYAGDAIPGFGNLLLIKHAGGWVSAYGHNDALLVARGARVKAGEVVARAGQSGAVAEPQLHFELRRGRTPLDPARLIGGR